MRAYDQLPSELRAWLASATLPWQPRSAKRAYRKALARTQSKDRALLELDRLEERLLTKDAARVWGPGHPMTSPVT